MKLFLKPIFELVTGEFTFSDNPMINLIAVTLIGLIAFVIAWVSVNRLYDDGFIEGRTVGSIIHWVIRFIAFTIVSLIVNVGLWIYRFMLTVTSWQLVLGVSIVAAIILSVNYIKRRVSY